MTSVADESLVDDLVVVDDIEPATRARRSSTKVLVVVCLAFVLTRGVAGYAADHPKLYGPHRADGTGDVQRYDELSWNILRERKDAYGAEVSMEYPPGAIPVIMVPRVVRLVSYRTEFIAMMVAVDALGLVALVRMARRNGSWWGVATWLCLVPLLGPVSYTRFDLVVAVLLVWTIERALAGRWDYVGLLVGAGVAVKLVPIALLPLLFFVAPREKRRALVGWTGAVIGVAVLPYVDRLPELYHSVVTYHTERTIQAESLWGSGVMVARWVIDYPVSIVTSHRAWDAQSGVSPLLQNLSSVASFAALVTGLVLARRTGVGDVRRASVLVFAVMTLLVGVSKVYSPQYIVWLIALAAVAVALAPRQMAPAIVTLTVVTGLAHLLFPYWFWDLLFFDKGGPVIALAVRNALTIITGLLGLWAWRSCGRCHTPSA